MAFGRLWRTVRYLTREQWLYRFVRRSRRIVTYLFPAVIYRRTMRAAEKLPLPEVTIPEAIAISEVVLHL